MKGCRPLSNEEVAAVVGSFTGAFAKRDLAMFILGVRTGFRISELLSLKVENVVRSGQIVDRVTVQRRNMKGKNEGRTVVLHPIAKQAINDWLKEMGNQTSPGAYLFASRKGDKPISRVQAWRILDRVFEKTGLEGSLGSHSMRKTFANRVYEALGQNIFLLQKAMGHRSINSTTAYLSFREEEVDSAILAA
jgi:integrase